MVISPQTHYGLSPFKLDAQISKFLSWRVLPCYQIGSDLANKKKRKKKTKVKTILSDLSCRSRSENIPQISNDDIRKSIPLSLHIIFKSVCPFNTLFLEI